jgi:HSP20 family protein
MDNEEKVPVSKEATESKNVERAGAWHPFDTLRNQIDRLLEDFSRGGFRHPLSRGLSSVEPFWRAGDLSAVVPAIDIAEKENAFEVTAELPGMEEKDIELKLANGNMIISGNKKEETEEKKKDYYLSERRYGSFQRSFRLPEGVDASAVEAQFSKGVLKIHMPKTAAAMQPERSIPIKSS